MLKKKIKKTNTKQINVSPSIVLMKESSLNEYSLIEKGELEKKDFSFIPNENIERAVVLLDSEIPDMTTHYFEIEKQFAEEEEEILELIEATFQQETNINKDEEFDYFYVKSTNPLDQRRVNINGYAIPKGTVESTLTYTNEGTKYIDLVTFPELLPSVLYHKKMISNDETHLYIYLGEASSFLAIYENGRYTTSTRFPINLKSLHDAMMNEMGNQKIAFDKFIELLINRGFDVDAYDTDSLPILDILTNSLFFHVFVEIHNYVQHMKQMVTHIGNIDKTFIGTEFGNIPKIDIYSEDKFLKTKTINFNFNSFVTKAYGDKNDPLLGLVELLYQDLDVMPEDLEFMNLSPFKRPPLFKNRIVSKPIIALGISIVVAGLIPVGQKIYFEYLDFNIQKLEKKASYFKEIFAKTEAYKKQVTTRKSTLEKQEKDLQAEIDNNIEKLKKLKYKKQNIEYMTSYMINVFDRLSKNNLIINDFKLKQKEMVISIETNQHFNIGNFSEDLLKEKIYNLKIGQVSFNKETNTYKTTLTLKKVN